MTQQNDKKEYEVAFLVKAQDGQGVVETLLRQHGADILLKGPMAETRLAYPIKKFNQAYFGYIHFAAAPDQVEKIMHNANLNQAILRVLVVTPPVGKNAPVRSERAEKSAKKPEAAAPATVGGMLTNEALSERLEEILK